MMQQQCTKEVATGNRGRQPIAPLAQVDPYTSRARLPGGDNGFDANGNWLGPNGSQVFTWNVENQLISTSGSANKGGKTWSA